MQRRRTPGTLAAKLGQPNLRLPRNIRGRNDHRRPRRDAIAILQLRAWMYAWMHVLPRYQKPLVTGHVADLPHTASGGTPAHRRNDERNPSLVRPRALGLEHRRCRYAYGALRHFAKRISAVPRIPATTAGANEVSAQWNNRLLEQGRQVASVSDRHHWRAGVRAPEHRVPEKQSDIGNPRLREIFFLCSGSQPLPQLITGCQNPAMVLVPARGLEFGRFRSGTSPAMCRPAVIPPANWPTSGGCPRERGHLRRQARGRGRLRCPWRRARGAGPRGEPVGRLRAVLPVARALRSGLARTPCVTGNRRRPSASRSRRELPRPLFPA